MSLIEDLKRLEKLDHETYAAWRMSMDQLRTFARFSIKEEDPLSLAWLQWCIQKAIEGKGWDLAQYARDELRLFHDEPKIEYWAIINRSGVVGDSPAEALLSAYRQALEAQ